MPHLHDFALSFASGIVLRTFLQCGLRVSSHFLTSYVTLALSYLTHQSFVGRAITILF